MAAFLRRLKVATRSTFNFLVERPGAAAVLAGAATVVAGGVYSTQIKPVRFRRAIESTLQAGSKPELIPCFTPIDRPEVIIAVKNLLRESGKFGVVIAPSGTGKSYATRVVCNEDPSWILYHEIYEPRNAARELAKAAGFIGEGFFDFIFESVNPSKGECPYYRLPEKHVEAVSYVLDVVGERAKYMMKKKQLKMLPCFVIDGVDLVAKAEPEVFQAIVDRAKYWANLGALKIVLVSSEGHVMPLIEGTSASNRSARIVEVLDIDDSKAVDYLVKCNVPLVLAKRLSTLTGNRMIYLENVASIYKTIGATMDEDQFVEEIKKYLRRFVQNALDETAFNDPPSYLIVKKLLQHGPMTAKQIVEALRQEKDLPHWDEKRIKEVIFSLVAANLLRYQADKTLTWHSKIIHDVVLKEIK